MTTANPTFESLQASLTEHRDKQGRNALQSHFETNEDGHTLEQYPLEVTRCLNCGQATLRNSRPTDYSPLRDYCGRWSCRAL